jgi:tetratricopeptide (TPR) repeat protein
MADFTQDEVPSVKRPDDPAPAPEKSARMPGMYVRERVLIACVVLMIAFFGFTAFVTRQYHRTVHRYADQWFAKGESALNVGNPKVAINDYRNALVYKPDDPTFQFHLAQALASAGQEAQSQAYLLNLLSENPGSGPINLTLAWVAVRLKKNADAVRYYHSAIYGVWETDPITRRWEVRREVCEYLLSQGDVHQAEPDLIALAQEVPSGDAGRGKIAGNLLLRAGLWNRALTEFRAVLATARHDPDALAGAGRAAFGMGEYPQAVGYWTRLPREKREAPDVAQMLQTAQEVESMNALRAGLPASEQARRAAKALSIANARIAACAKQRGATSAPAAGAAPSQLQQLHSTAQKNERVWTESSLARQPDQITAAMAFAFQAEAAAARACGAPRNASDRALSLIASHEAGQASE